MVSVQPVAVCNPSGEAMLGIPAAQTAAHQPDRVDSRSNLSDDETSFPVENYLASINSVSQSPVVFSSGQATTLVLGVDANGVQL